MQAQEAYIEAIAAETTDARRAQIEAALKAYCGQDTLAMVAIADKLVGNNRRDVIQQGARTPIGNAGR